MENNKIRVAITQGDTNGVGYEVIMKAFEDPAMLDLCTPIIYGSPKVATYHRNTLQIESNFSIIKTAEEAKDMRVNMLTVIEDEVKVDMGQPTPESAEAARISYEKAKEDYQKGLFDVLVTAPANQESTDPKALVVYMNDNLRVALVTKDVAIKEVSEAITQQKIIEKARLFHQSLRRDMRIANPRIAVLSLNPPSGNDGWQGEEEEEVIIPAIAALEQEGIQAFGPYAADRIFGTSDYLRFDGVLAMYYDQGLAPFKSIVTEGSVRLTTGLPLIITAPCHGVDYAIAGQGIEDGSAMRHAIFTAIDVFRNRRNYDEPLQNPLPKLYHEKRDDSEKVRFAQPRAKDLFKKAPNTEKTE